MRRCKRAACTRVYTCVLCVSTHTHMYYILIDAHLSDGLINWQLVMHDVYSMRGLTCLK